MSSWEQRVEAAARAMHEVPAQPGVYGRIPWDRLIEQHRDAYRQMALAAFHALQPSPAMRVDRYWLCGDDCTTDCGICKGAGRPAAQVDDPAAAVELPWCNLPICPEGGNGEHRITAGRCVVVPNLTAPLAGQHTTDEEADR